MDRSEEQRLVREAAAGNRRAIQSLVDAHQRSLYGFVLRMSGKPDVAEDVVQEAFVRVICNIARFDPKFRFSTWVFTIARRLYINHAQRFTPRFNSDALDQRPQAAAGPAESVQRADERHSRRSALDRAVLTLSAEQREVILLFYQQDWSMRRIADHMGLAEGTVKSHLHRGRTSLREAIERELHGGSSRSPATRAEPIDRIQLGMTGGGIGGLAHAANDASKGGLGSVGQTRDAGGTMHAAPVGDPAAIKIPPRRPSGSGGTDAAGWMPRTVATRATRTGGTKEIGS